MNRDVTIRIPKGSSIRQKIRNIYTELFKQWKQAYPSSASYPISKLKQNIRNALSIHGKVFKEERFSQSRYNKWRNGIVICYSHFYWLVNFRQDRKGNIIADVVDACYEGDYHNDTMNTTPYGEGLVKNRNKNIIKEQIDNTMKTKKKVVRLTESDLHRIIEGAVREALNEIGDTYRGQYMMGRASARANSRDNRQTEYDLWNRARKERALVGKRDAADMNDAYGRGYSSEKVLGSIQDQGNKYRQHYRIRDDFKTYAMMDSEERQRKFLTWMYEDNVAMQRAVEYMKGYDNSALSELIIQYEDKIGGELSDEHVEDIKTALNTWWNYNEVEFENY